MLTHPCVPWGYRGGSRVFTMLNFELHAKGNRLVGMAGTAVFAAAMLYISLGEGGNAKEPADTDGRRGTSEDLSDGSVLRTPRSAHGVGGAGRA